VLSQRLATVVGRPVACGAVLVASTGFTVDGLRLPRTGSETRDPLVVQGSGAVAVVPHASPEMATHPVTDARVVLGFAPDRTEVRSLAVHGPRGNLELSGVWRDVGPVQAHGRAWLTREATRALLRPTGMGWLARLVGPRSLGSEFTVRGTAQGLYLDAASAHGPLWHLANHGIAREMRALLRGEVPLMLGTSTAR
jgi:hypothetical protein